jgi:hypothetical protein
MDGKTKKAYKLELLREEAEIVKFIFTNFLRNNSLTKTETLLLNNGYKTKNSKLFTRFAVKNILTNPVYMAADGVAYNYLREREADLFAEEREFDGKRGIMAYNRTIQKPGKATVVRPISEWIVAVGKHEAIISGEDWIKAQEQLGQNSSKSYRKPRSNVALLSGLLFCECGDYMRPKLSKRRNSQGELIYTYLCAMKEKSRMLHCQGKNINGNMLDAAICEKIKRLDSDSAEFAKLLEQSARKLADSRDGYDESIKHLRGEISAGEKEIGGLVSALTRAAGTPSEGYIMKQIAEQHKKIESFKARIGELEGLTATNVLSDTEFDLLRQLLSGFHSTFGAMEIEQKRNALLSFIKQIVWDSKRVHVFLLGADGCPAGGA